MTEQDKKIFKALKGIKQFKVKVLEQEQWERHYLIEAKDEDEAKDKAITGDIKKILFKEMYNFESDVDNLEELKK